MENENIQPIEEGLSLMDIFHILKVHLIAILIFIVAGGIIGVGCALITKPSYVAEQRIYLINTPEIGSSGDVGDGVVESLRIIDTFKDFLTDPSVAKKTIDLIKNNDELSDFSSQYQDSLDYKSIIKGISTSTTTDTTICVTVSYTSANQEFSCVVLENIILATQQISNNDEESDVKFDMFENCITIANQPNNYGDGKNCEWEEQGASKVLYGLIGIAGGLVIGVIYAFVREALDNTVNNKKYIEEKYNIKVIGNITDLADEAKFEEE